MRVESIVPVGGVDVVDIDRAEGEGQVDDDEEEQEDEDVEDHVGDADDHGAGRAPHQSALNGSEIDKTRSELELVYLLRAWRF